MSTAYDPNEYLPTIDVCSHLSVHLIVESFTNKHLGNLKCSRFGADNGKEDKKCVARTIWNRPPTTQGMYIVH